MILSDSVNPEGCGLRDEWELSGDSAKSALATGRKRRLQLFFQNPLVGAIATIATIISLPLAIYFYFASVKTRELVYSSSASPTTIVKAGQSSALRVFYRDAPITDDVSSIQVAIWNEGKESIRRDNILSKTIDIQLDPPVPILETRIRRQTRGVLNFRCSAAQSLVSCTWDILEHRDGGLLQIIYRGTSGRVTVKGIVEGQRPIRQITQETGISIWATIVISIITGAMPTLATLLYERFNKFKSFLSVILFGGLISVIAIVLVMFLSYLFKVVMTTPSPLPL